MRLLPEQSSLPRLLVFPFIALGGFGFFWLRWKPELVLRLAHCQFREVTGIPCPTCGGTHAAASIAAGNIYSALMSNPLVVLFGGIFLLWATWAILALVIPRLRFSVELNSQETKATRILAALVFILTWFWQLILNFR